LSAALENLPLLQSPLRWNKRQKDFICFSDECAQSAHFLIYAVSGKVDSMQGCQLTFSLKRDSSSHLTTFGVRMLGRPPVGKGELVMISGWKETAVALNKPGEFIYVIGSTDSQTEESF
jgi:hypothetical protein